VKQFEPGDEVFGDLFESGYGAYAEYVCASENCLALRPANMTWEEAAAVPQAALVALQGLRDMGQIRPGQKVLINGASGGNGTFAVQIAKSFGAEVTGVCSTRNVDLVRSIGADHVIDYTQEDFAKNGQRYDLIFDVVGNRSISDYLRALSAEGNYVAVQFSAAALFLGPLISMIGSNKVGQFSHSSNPEDLVFMKELIESGKVKSVIDRSYPLNEVPDALRYYGEGHSRGKVVITVGQSND
jgi:NADPH:quinone reductase-like Zn-dependent oxidoreductase